MTVSAIIPVFQGERYLEEAIRSVLDQTRPPDEIIAVDDGSTDGSAGIAASFLPDVRLVYQQNAGTSSARNRGVRESTGECLAFLDQDDLWEGEKLQTQLAAFEDHPEAGAIFGHVQQFVSPELEKSVRERFACPEEPQEGYAPSTMLIRREAFLEVGYFDERWQQAEWIEWLLRLRESGCPILMLDAVVSRRRIHPGNKGVVRRADTSEYLYALKESVDRRR